MPTPGSNNGELSPIDGAKTITVHAADVRAYSNGNALDSTHQISPLSVGFAPPALDAPWHGPFTASDEQSAEAHRVQWSSLRAAVRRLLTLEQEQRESNIIDRAIRALSVQQEPDGVPAGPGGGEEDTVPGQDRFSTATTATSSQVPPPPSKSKRRVQPSASTATSSAAHSMSTRPTNRGSHRRTYSETDDSGEPFISILSVSDDGEVVDGLIRRVGGVRTDDPVVASRYIVSLCKSDRVLLERWRLMQRGE